MKLSLITALKAKLIKEVTSDTDARYSEYAIPLIPEDVGGQTTITVAKHLDMSEALEMLISVSRKLGDFVVPPTEAMRYLTEVFARPPEWQSMLVSAATYSRYQIVYCIDASRGYLDIDIEMCFMPEIAFKVRDPILVEHNDAVAQYKSQQVFIRHNKDYPLMSWGLGKDACVQFSEPFMRDNRGYYILVVKPMKLFNLTEKVEYYISVVGATQDKMDIAIDKLTDRDCNSIDDKEGVKAAITSFFANPDLVPRNDNTVGYHIENIECPDGVYSFYMKCYMGGFNEMILLESPSEEVRTAIKDTIANDCVFPFTRMRSLNS